MRALYLVVVLLFSLSAFSQVNLSVNLVRSQSKYDIDFIVDTLKIYKDSALFRVILHPDSFALYEEVAEGTYNFQYKNLFAEKVEQTFEIKERNNVLGGQDINLVVDQLQQPKTRFSALEKLGDGETMIIKYKISGCYVNSTDSLKILKKSEKFILEYGKRKRKLKQIDLEALRQYELELRNLPEVNFVSTGNGINELSVSGEKFCYIEPSSFWSGFEILKKRLKL